MMVEMCHESWNEIGSFAPLVEPLGERQLLQKVGSDIGPSKALTDHCTSSDRLREVAKY